MDAARVLADFGMTGRVVRGKYAIQGVIGRGGMGFVLKARHVHLNNVVALKFMRPEVHEIPDAADRFLREARIAASLQSEHIVRIYDVDVDEFGTPFMAMEYLEGEELSKLLQRKTVFSAKDAVRYTLEICEALAEAHAKNFVHRDLKPANMFLAKKWGGKEVVKLLDFGISKIHSGTLSKELTSEGSYLGSPCYMAPEQIASAKQVDQRADIWSLGVCLYRFLSGKLPFDSANVWEITTLVKEVDPKRLEELRPDLSPALAMVVHRCLEKAPERRYQSVEEVMLALRSLGESGLENGPPDVSDVHQGGHGEMPTGSAVEADRRHESIVPAVGPRRRALVAGLVAVCLLSGAGIGMALVRSRSVAVPEEPEVVVLTGGTGAATRVAEPAVSGAVEPRTTASATSALPSVASSAGPKESADPRATPRDRLDRKLTVEKNTGEKRRGSTKPEARITEPVPEATGVIPDER